MGWGETARRVDDDVTAIIESDGEAREGAGGGAFERGAGVVEDAAVLRTDDLFVFELEMETTVSAAGGRGVEGIAGADDEEAVRSGECGKDTGAVVGLNRASIDGGGGNGWGRGLGAPGAAAAETGAGGCGEGAHEKIAAIDIGHLCSAVIGEPD